MESWDLPTPSAFSPEGVEAVREWVEAGGSLLLFADHMPMPGAARDLAAAFGVRFSNGFALDPDGMSGQLVFRRSDGSLRSDAGVGGILRPALPTVPRIARLRDFSTPGAVMTLE